MVWKEHVGEKCSLDWKLVPKRREIVCAGVNMVSVFRKALRLMRLR